MDSRAYAELDDDQRERLAKRRNLRLDTQLLLAGDWCGGAVHGLARNLTLRPEVQQVLVRDSDEHVRGNLAGNAALLPELQGVLASDTAECVRRALARNESLAAEVQERLAQDESAAVREALVMNASVTFTSAFPAALLEITDRGRGFIAEHLERSRLDPEDVKVLRDGWSGTLGELVTTARELSAQPA
jgi:hypothetical protein